MPVPTPERPQPEIASLPDEIEPATVPLNIAIVGTGYVGLVSGACLAAIGHKVECIERDSQRVALLRQGQVPFYEPGLPELLARCGRQSETGQPTLRFATPDTASLPEADVVFLAVGTPTAADGHSADLRALMDAARDAARSMRPDTVLVIKSTSPVGTGDEVAQLVARVAPHSRIAVASNPEFLREGRAVGDFLQPDRVVVGVENETAARVLQQLYEPLAARGAPVLLTTRRTAELIKYASNAFLATKLAFINEMADLCDRVGADVVAVSRGIGLDPRIGTQYLQPGPGHGGSCLPKDLLALAHTGREAGMTLQLIETVQRLNEVHQARMIEKIEAVCGGAVSGKTIGFLGVAFKPETDDVRESPALSLIDQLHRRGAHVRATDPQAMGNALRLMPSLQAAVDAYACAADADALVLATHWDDYRALDLDRLRGAMRGSGFVDLRNALSPGAVRGAGFIYVDVGRASIAPRAGDW